MLSPREGSARGPYLDDAAVLHHVPVHLLILRIVLLLLHLCRMLSAKHRAGPGELQPPPVGARGGGTRGNEGSFTPATGGGQACDLLLDPLPLDGHGQAPRLGATFHKAAWDLGCLGVWVLDLRQLGVARAALLEGGGSRGCSAALRIRA